jgi:S1-C subfamily serine protease
MFDEKGKRGLGRTSLTIALTSLSIGVLLFFFASRYMAGDNNIQNQQNPPMQNRSDVPLPQQIAAETDVTATTGAASVAKSASPAVVGISVLKVDSGSLFDSNASEKWGVGSGVIASPNGYIITNHHVAGGRNKRIVVSLADGRNVDGVTKWSDPVLDLAIVKIELTDLPVIPLGDSNALQVGEAAIAIGNPLGLQFQRTVTQGIISALKRTIKIDTEQGSNYMEDLIQTDAAINPGNSGGPLLNARGQVIGINTIKVTSAEAIGFAIPINVAVPIVRRFVDENEFAEPYMGVFAYDREVIPYLDSSLKIDNGIYVVNVDDKGPAFRSGIRLGCIITHVDGNPVNTMMQLRTYIYSKKPGDSIDITHVSNGKSEVISMRLDAKDRDGLITR